MPLFGPRDLISPRGLPGLTWEFHGMTRLLRNMRGTAKRCGRVGVWACDAANCVRVNEQVLVAAGYPRFTAELRARKFDPMELDISEFRKMDGGLSCLSLRF
jgi:N-dimethylarginine dimethylaminohydrolase